MDTIYALASAQGKAGVAVIRLSGPAAHSAVARLAADVPPARHARLRKLLSSDGTLLDHALVLTFKEGASFTGEQSAELHLHGSTAIVRAVLQELSQIERLRLAGPGEFTRRALENGRLDLTEVEGLADLIEAETEAQRRLALRVFEGAFGDRVGQWREALIQALALLAVTIDFSDQDIPDDMTQEVRAILMDVRSGLEKEIAGICAAERIRDGFEVAIVGPPNIGKSTLLNTLAGRDAALTSEIAGTTRDVIEVRMDLSGLAVTFLDTAGLRETEDYVEGLGIERALIRAEQADIRVILTEGATPDQIALRDDDIVLRGKADLVESDCGISGITGAGVNRLLSQITERLTELASHAGVATQERHRIAMAKAASILDDVIGSMEHSTDHTELLSEDLRHAVLALDALVGKVDVEDLLDSIFRKFCLGK